MPSQGILQVRRAFQREEVIEASSHVLVEAIEKGVTEVAKYDADDWFVIAVTASPRSFYS